MKYFLTKNITSLEKKVMMTFRVNAIFSEIFIHREDLKCLSLRRD